MIYIILLILLILLIIYYPRDKHKDVVMPWNRKSVTYKEYNELLKGPVEVYILYDDVYQSYIIYSWSMNYYAKTGVLSIGCRDNTIDGWKHFFKNNCTIQYQTKRDTLAFKYVKTKFYQFLKELEKQKIIQ